MIGKPENIIRCFFRVYDFISLAHEIHPMEQYFQF